MQADDRTENGQRHDRQYFLIFVHTACPEFRLTTTASHFISKFPIRIFELAALSKLEVNKRYRTGCWKELQREKCANVCRDLNARRLQSQAINKLISFLRGC